MSSESNEQEKISESTKMRRDEDERSQSSLGNLVGDVLDTQLNSIDENKVDSVDIYNEKSTSEICSGQRSLEGCANSDCEAQYTNKDKDVEKGTSDASYGDNDDNDYSENEKSGDDYLGILECCSQSDCDSNDNQPAGKLILLYDSPHRQMIQVPCPVPSYRGRQKKRKEATEAASGAGDDAGMNGSSKASGMMVGKKFQADIPELLDSEAIDEPPVLSLCELIWPISSDENAMATFLEQSRRLLLSKGMVFKAIGLFGGDLTKSCQFVCSLSDVRDSNAVRVFDGAETMTLSIDDCVTSSHDDELLEIWQRHGEHGGLDAAVAAVQTELIVKIRSSNILRDDLKLFFDARRLFGEKIARSSSLSFSQIFSLRELIGLAYDFASMKSKMKEARCLNVFGFAASLAYRMHDTSEFDAEDFLAEEASSSRIKLVKNGVTSTIIRAVDCYTHDGCFVKHFPSVTIADVNTVFSARNILACLRGSAPHVQGITWRYCNESNCGCNFDIVPSIDNVEAEGNGGDEGDEVVDERLFGNESAEEDEDEDGSEDDEEALRIFRPDEIFITGARTRGRNKCESDGMMEVEESAEDDSAYFENNPCVEQVDATNGRVVMRYKKVEKAARKMELSEDEFARPFQTLRELTLYGFTFRHCSLKDCSRRNGYLSFVKLLKSRRRADKNYVAKSTKTVSVKTSSTKNRLRLPSLAEARKMPIEQSDSVTEKVLRRYGTLAEAAVAMRMEPATIFHCARGLFKSARSFKFRFCTLDEVKRGESKYIAMEDLLKISMDNLSEKEKQENAEKLTTMDEFERGPSTAKCVEQTDEKTGEVVRRYVDVSTAADAMDLSAWEIAQSLKIRGNFNRYGFIFRYCSLADYTDNLEASYAPLDELLRRRFVADSSRNLRKRNKNYQEGRHGILDDNIIFFDKQSARKSPVEQSDPVTKKVLRRYNTLQEAAVAMQIDPNDIYNCAKGPNGPIRSFIFRFCSSDDVKRGAGDYVPVKKLLQIRMSNKSWKEKKDGVPAIGANASVANHARVAENDDVMRVSERRKSTHRFEPIKNLKEAKMLPVEQIDDESGGVLHRYATMLDASKAMKIAVDDIFNMCESSDSALVDTFNYRYCDLCLVGKFRKDYMRIDRLLARALENMAVAQISPTDLRVLRRYVSMSDASHVMSIPIDELKREIVASSLCRGYLFRLCSRKIVLVDEPTYVPIPTLLFLSELHAMTWDEKRMVPVEILELETLKVLRRFASLADAVSLLVLKESDLQRAFEPIDIAHIELPMFAIRFCREDYFKAADSAYTISLEALLELRLGDVDVTEMPVEQIEDNIVLCRFTSVKIALRLTGLRLEDLITACTMNTLLNGSSFRLEVASLDLVPVKIDVVPVEIGTSAVSEDSDDDISISINEDCKNDVSAEQCPSDELVSEVLSSSIKEFSQDNVSAEQCRSDDFVYNVLPSSIKEFSQDNVSVKQLLPDNGRVVHRYVSVKAAAQAMQIKTRIIRRYCENKKKIKLLHGFIFRFCSLNEFASNDAKDYVPVHELLAIRMESTTVKERYSRPVEQYSISSSKILRCFDSIIHAGEKLRMSASDIYAICTDEERSSHQSIEGFSFRFREDRVRGFAVLKKSRASMSTSGGVLSTSATEAASDIKIIPPIDEEMLREQNAKYDATAVVQYHAETGQLLRRYSSIAIAANILNLDVQKIHDNCSGKTAKYLRFVFRYCEDNDVENGDSHQYHSLTDIIHIRRSLVVEQMKAESRHCVLRRYSTLEEAAELMQVDVGALRSICACESIGWGFSFRFVPYDLLDLDSSNYTPIADLLKIRLCNPSKQDRLSLPVEQRLRSSGELLRRYENVKAACDAMSVKTDELMKCCKRPDLIFRGPFQFRFCEKRMLNVDADSYRPVEEILFLRSIGLFKKHLKSPDDVLIEDLRFLESLGKVANLEATQEFELLPLVSEEQRALLRRKKLAFDCEHFESITADRKVSMFDRKWHILGHFISIHEVSKVLKISAARIHACCRGLLASVEGFTFRYCSQTSFDSESGLDPKIILLPVRGEILRRAMFPVEQVHVSKRVIVRRYHSVLEASNAIMVDVKDILNSCNSTGPTGHIRGFLFRRCLPGAVDRDDRAYVPLNDLIAVNKLSEYSLPNDEKVEEFQALQQSVSDAWFQAPKEDVAVSLSIKNFWDIRGRFANIDELSEMYKISEARIHACCRGLLASVEGYSFRYCSLSAVGEDPSLQSEGIDSIKIGREQKLRVSLFPVELIEASSKVILRRFSTIIDASNAIMIDSGLIRQSCAKPESQDHVRGFLFRFCDAEAVEKDASSYLSIRKLLDVRFTFMTLEENQRRSIERVSTETGAVNRYKSLKIAATNKSVASLSDLFNRIQNREQVNGFFYRFSDPADCEAEATSFDEVFSSNAERDHNEDMVEVQSRPRPLKRERARQHVKNMLDRYAIPLLCVDNTMENENEADDICEEEPARKKRRRRAEIHFSKKKDTLPLNGHTPENDADVDAGTVEVKQNKRRRRAEVIPTGNTPREGEDANALDAAVFKQMTRGRIDMAPTDEGVVPEEGLVLPPSEGLQEQSVIVDYNISATDYLDVVNLFTADELDDVM